MPFSLGRPLARGDYVEISDQAKAELKVDKSGPYLVESIEERPDANYVWRTAVKLADFKYLPVYVFEDHVRAVEPPRMSLAEKELAAREPWQRRRDENLRKVFRGERL